MSRSYSSQNIISLPVTTGRTLYALAQEVIDAANAQKSMLEAHSSDFPQALLPALERLKLAHGNLGTALQPTIASQGSETREADRVLDNAWGSVYDFLMAWLKQDPAVCPDPQGTQLVFDLLFSEGKGFLNLDYKSEWVESDRRLASLKESPHIDCMLALGGIRIVEGLELAHLNYGKALGITTQSDDDDTQTMGGLSLELRHRLRDFVVKAVAWEEPTIEGSSELSAALLLPVETWEGPSSGSKAQGEMAEVEGGEPEGLEAQGTEFLVAESQGSEQRVA